MVFHIHICKKPYIERCRLSVERTLFTFLRLTYLETCLTPNKAAVVTIIAEPGQNKSEITARIVEDFDKLNRDNNAAYVLQFLFDMNTWVSCRSYFH